MAQPRVKVLIFTEWFEPGYKAGGPIRSCVNIARQLKDERDIYIFTSDTDLGASAPYAGIQSDVWVEWEPGIKVFYASAASRKWSVISREIRAADPGFVYLNSMFSLHYTIYPLLIKKVNGFRARVILAPRGMLRASALQFKNRKKKAFLNLFRLLNIHKLITFHATDEVEFSDVKKQFGSKANAVIVNDFPGLQQAFMPPVQKLPGHAKLLFIGRIHPVKNLDYFLQLLKGINSKTDLTIVASLEDKAYWQQCETLIQQLPPNVKVNFKGELPNHELEHIIRQHHLFVLPTKGENFGHAIFEALAAGRPVLISDQTPWRHLQPHKAGWDISLNEPAKFAAVVEEVAAMDEPRLHEWCTGAWNYCKTYLEQSGIKEQYLKLFS